MELKARFIVRVAGAVVILVSVFLLPWFLGASLYGIADVATVLATPAIMAFIYATLALVIVGGALSLARRIGGVLALVGASLFIGLFMLQSPRAIAFMGVGVWAALAGAIVVLASKRIAAVAQRVKRDKAIRQPEAEDADESYERLVKLSQKKLRKGKKLGKRKYRRVLLQQGKRKKVIGIALAVVIIAAAAGLGWQFLVVIPASTPPAAEPDTIPPVASITIASMVGLIVDFSGADSTDNVGIVSYDWAFGDGGRATGVTVSHTFRNSGSQTVSLKVKDAAGNVDTVFQTFEIPVPSSFTVSVSQSPDGLIWEILFTEVPLMLAPTVSLVVFSADGVMLITETPITSLADLWDGQYIPIDATDYIAVGDVISLSVSTYPPGSTFKLVESASFAVLVEGILQ